MTEFITRNHGHSCFEVMFKTTDPEHYKAIQDFARRLIDHAKPVTDNNVGSKWIPVTERLPEKGKEYLCLCNIDGHIEYPFFMVLRYYLVDKKPHFQHESDHGLRVTHWMPIPEPPKEVE